VANEAHRTSGPARSTDAGDLELLTRAVIPGDAVEPFGAYLFAADEPGAAVARALEAQVFLETFGDTDDVFEAEYGPYEPSSFFICVIDHLRGLPAGAMRVLLPSPAGFKSLNDIEPVWGVSAAQLGERSGLSLDPGRVWDVATLAVAPDYRGSAAQGLVSMGLFQTLGLAALRCDVEWFVAILDMPVFRIVRWKLRMVFVGYEGVGPRWYLGSPASIPTWCNVASARRHLAETDPDLYDVLVHGVGLEAALRRVDLESTDRLAARGLAGAGA
jgi:hypothetical protein